MTLYILTSFIFVFVVLLTQWINWRQLRRLGQKYYSVTTSLSELKTSLSELKNSCDDLHQSVNNQSDHIENLAELLRRQSLAQDFLSSAFVELASKYEPKRQFVCNEELLSVGSSLIDFPADNQPHLISPDQPNIHAGSIPLQKFKPALLNIGCGNTYDPRWINIDLNPASPEVYAVNVLQPLPFPDSCIDVVYTSHVLEHIPPHAVPRFFHELIRILRPSGILRIVVPDLEQIAKEYLRALHAAIDGDPHDRLFHRWMIVELLDQLVRQSPDGGEMMRFLFRNGAEGIGIATHRLGSEIAETPVPWDARKTKGEWALEVGDQELFSDENLFERRSNTTLYELARFRTSGEAHLWMYDKVSLAELLLERGFVEPFVYSASSSSIPDFSMYQLDVTSDGDQRKPDSLYIEATLPQSNDS